MACNDSSTVWLAYSGGLDSHVLLHLYANMRTTRSMQLKAIHINHNLSPFAAKWADHCAKVCAELNVPLLVQNIEVKASSGESLENEARQCRYHIFSQTLAPGDQLLTAHQQDDQAETLLLQMLRGAGPKGLASMPRIKPFAQGFHVRPLLEFSRAELKRYAEHHQLQWIEDESNHNVDFTRNFLRHDVLPILMQRWPTVKKTLARVAENCAEAQEIVAALAASDKKKVKGPLGFNTLSISKLHRLDPARQRQVVRLWLEESHFSLPSLKQMQHIQQDLFAARSDKVPQVSFGNVILRRYRDELYASASSKKMDKNAVYDWNFQQPLVITHLGVLHATLSEEQGLRPDLFPITVRFRKGGETCQLPQRACHHELKKLFQQWGVPPWERDRVPLLYLGDTLIAVVGYFMDERFVTKNGYLISLAYHEADKYKDT